MTKWDSFLFTNWDDVVFNKIFSLGGLIKNVRPLSKRNMLVKFLWKTFVTKLNRYQGVIPRIKAFFGDSKVYARLLQRCKAVGGKNCVKQVAALKNPNFIERRALEGFKKMKIKQRMIKEMKRKNPDFIKKNPKWEPTQEAIDTAYAKSYDMVDRLGEVASFGNRAFQIYRKLGRTTNMFGENRESEYGAKDAVVDGVNATLMPVAIQKVRLGYRVRKYIENKNGCWGGVCQGRWGNPKSDKKTVDDTYWNRGSAYVFLNQADESIAATSASTRLKDRLRGNTLHPALQAYLEKQLQSGSASDPSGTTQRLYKKFSRDIVMIDAEVNNTIDRPTEANDEKRSVRPHQPCKFDFDRTVDKPTHTTATPYCHGNYDWEYTYGGKTLPLFVESIAQTSNKDGWVKTKVGSTKPVPDARNKHVYKCVQTKPASGEAYPSMWLDEDFKRVNDFNNKYYHDIAIYTDTRVYDKTKFKYTGGDLYKGKFNPGNYGKFFYGYKKETMCDEELRLLTIMGRKDASLPANRRPDWLTVFKDPTVNNSCFRTTQSCKWDGSVKQIVCKDSTKHFSSISSIKSCGQCLATERNTEASFETKTSGKPTLDLSEEECLTYATLIGENTKFYANDSAPADPAGCVVKPDKSTVYFNRNTDGKSNAVECGSNQYNMECVIAKNVTSNPTDEDSCRAANGFWEPFEWRQTPNVNEAMTCFEGCGGWCVPDAAKTEAIGQKRCSISGDQCNNDGDCACDEPPIVEDTCLNVANGQFNMEAKALVAGSWDDRPSGCSVHEDDSTVHFNRKSGVVKGKDKYITVNHPNPECNQTCNNTIETCKTFSHTINVRRFCDSSSQDSRECRAVAAGTYNKEGEMIMRQTAGKDGHWDVKGKCGLGFAYKFDANVDWCGPLRMTNMYDDYVNCEGTYVSQLCERKMPDELMSKPFKIQSRRLPTVGECRRSSKDDCEKEATVRGIGFEEKDVGSDNHCNMLATKTTEHPLNKTKTFDQAKAFCEAKGARLATRSEVLDFMAYLPDAGKSWTPVGGGPGNDWMFIGKEEWSYGDMHDEIANGAYGRPQWGTGTTEQAFRKTFFCTRPSKLVWGKRITEVVGVLDEEAFNNDINAITDEETAQEEESKPRYIRIESADDWLQISQVTAKSKDDSNLSMGKACTSSGPYKGREANKCGIALDGKEKMRNYTDNINNVGDDYGVFHSNSQNGSFWQVDLGDDGASLDSITIHNRKEVQERDDLGTATLKVLDANNNELYRTPLSNATMQTFYPLFSTPVQLHQLFKKKSPVSLDLRYLRIEAPGEWMNFSQVTAKDRRGNNLSRGKPCASDGAYKNRINNACEVALDGNERVRTYTDGTPSATHGNFHSVSKNSYWEVDLEQDGSAVDTITIHNRARYQSHLSKATMTFLDDNRDVMATKKLSGANEQTFTVHSLTRCPAGTLPYHKGSHCCKFPLDLNGQPLSYNIMSCKDHKYIECPGGAIDGRCVDDYDARVLGAYKDTGSRAMRRGPQKYGYNVESCQNACKDYKYFSLQNNGWCSCEDDKAHATKYGTSSCNGMGGGWCNYIYKNIDVAANNTPIGPFKDTGSRAFRHGPKAYGYNVGSCQKACKDYKYFALQNNGWCSCENDLQHATKYGTSSCGFYGGGWCNYIFRNDDLKAPTLLAADDNVKAYPMGTKNYAQIALDCRKRGGYMATGEQILEHLKFKARHPSKDSWTPYRTVPMVQVTSGMPAKNVAEAECKSHATGNGKFFKVLTDNNAPQGCLAKQPNGTSGLRVNSFANQPVGAPLGNTPWKGEEHCKNFTFEKATAAIYFQNAGNRCYAYGPGGQSGRCGGQCWQTSGTAVTHHSHSNQPVGAPLGNTPWKDEEHCRNFAFEKATATNYFQNAGNRCYAYGPGSQGGRCGRQCWELTGARCPAGTLPYHKGSHCCKSPMDNAGQPLTYNSNHCKGHQYVACPSRGRGWPVHRRFRLTVCPLQQGKERQAVRLRLQRFSEELRPEGRAGKRRKRLRGQLPARHQRVDADRHETPPVRQGPRRLGVEARVGNAGRCPRLQTGILLRLSRKDQILLPRRPGRADVPIRPRRRELCQRRVRAVGRRPGQGLLHVLEREPRQGLPRPFSPGILRGYSAPHQRPVPKAREKVRRLLRFDHGHDHRRLRESVLVDGRVRRRRQVRKVRPVLPLDHQADDLPVRVQRVHGQRGQRGQVHGRALQWLQRQVRVLRVKKKGGASDAVELRVPAPPPLDHHRGRDAKGLAALVPAHGGLQGDGGFAP